MRVTDEQPPQACPPEVVARIYGQPLEQIPLDLYIPPDALEILLDAFEGPLDLLLYLIRKANIDILDIPMASLTRQYLDYVEAMRARNLELAADYLVMAAMLIEIKSRMLLPRVRTGDDEEAEDPRAELVRRLMEYEQMKGAARALDEMPQAERDFLWADVLVERTLLKRYPEVRLPDLCEAWQNVLTQARFHEHHQIAREELSVREHMGLILRYLQAHGGQARFENLFEPHLGAPVLVVHFIAMLELARESLVDIVQTEVFAPIHIRLAHCEGTRHDEAEDESETETTMTETAWTDTAATSAPEADTETGMLDAATDDV
ncbi:MAG: segregation/condensation protein A [Zoogloeaceae bacterium]|jgi:segregation and condensation protein A|nr:segregation/condensation protein A [Zoogloeaceae bacterium]